MTWEGVFHSQQSKNAANQFMLLVISTFISPPSAVHSRGPAFAKGFAWFCSPCRNGPSPWMPSWASLAWKRSLEQPSGTQVFLPGVEDAVEAAVPQCRLVICWAKRLTLTCWYLGPVAFPIPSSSVLALLTNLLSLSSCSLLPVAVPVLAAQARILSCSSSHGMLEGAHCREASLGWEALQWCELG